jgi:predicted O-linked N-acetylglucosamine transferase (SPINDLY family)
MTAPEIPLEALASMLEVAKERHQGNELEAAEAMYLDILAKDPMHFAAMHLLGILKHERRDFEAAAELLQRALSLNPRSPLAHLNLGKALWSLDRREEALRHYQMAFRFDASHPEALFQYAFALQALDRPEESLVLWDRFLASDSESASALLNRGMVMQDLRRPKEARANFDRALAIDPGLSEILQSRARKLSDAIRHEEALTTLDAILKSRPDNIEALIDRGGVLWNLLRPKEALASLELALIFRPDDPLILSLRAHILLILKRPLEALASCDRALSLQSNIIEALINRGAALLELHRIHEALEAYEQALTFQPDNPKLLQNQGVVLHNLGKNDDALAVWKRSLAIEPDEGVIHSGIISILDYTTGVSFTEQQAERRRYYESYARHHAPPEPIFTNDRDPSRRLVLGYVSADFRFHSAAMCFGPILQHHSKANFQVNCYSGVHLEDRVTKQFRDNADVWRQATNLSDDALAAQIREDRVDILVDLSGHSLGNRLLAFARKPAPIQVTAWGQGGGTGLPMIDYLFSDPVLIPKEARPLYAETIWDLPCCITFQAPEDAPEVVEPPMLSQGHITFGSLNRYSKVTPDVERLWARVLEAIPESRLLLKDGLFDDQSGRERVLASFAKLGVPENRITFQGGTSNRGHLTAFGSIDISLDPFPMNGGITTMESLWMGVPVLAVLGHTQSSRIAGAILHALNLGDWVASSEADFVELAIRKVSNAQALKHFRSSIRSRMLATPTGNPELYTQIVEEAYRTMWRRWLEASALDGSESLNHG